MCVCVGGEGGDVNGAGPVGAAARVPHLHLTQNGGEAGCLALFSDPILSTYCAIT